MNNNSSGGAAVLSVTLNVDDVQKSNFTANSFKITNTGNKKIAQVVIDVSSALYPDSVFDPFGQGGDTASKPLTINTDGSTGIVAPSNASYLGAGGKKGYDGIQLVFNENKNGGFQPGETVGFSVDMDPNSVAGTNKRQLDGGTNPRWDVGGVSGAELIGSTFTVTFEDGTKAIGQLQGANNQAGSQGLADQNSPNLPVSLTVNGFDAGGVGTYNNKPQVIVNGTAGQTARIVLTKGFIQPITPYADFLRQQLSILENADFPANNAVEFQTVDVTLTGGNQNISELFNFSNVPKYNFAGEDKLPIGFVASIIDTNNKNLPLGSVTKPIYLKFDANGSNNSIPVTQVIPSITTSGIVAVAENQTAVLNINATDGNGDTEGKGLRYSLTGGEDQSVFVINPNNGALSFASAPDFEKPQDINRNNVYEVEVGVFDSTNRQDRQLIKVSIEDVNENTNLAPTTNNGNSLKIEAEDITQVSGYRLENNGTASSGKILSLIGQKGGEVGTASFDFTGETGNYKVVLGTFDENDGNARLEISKNNSLIGAVDLTQNLGSRGAVAQTRVEHTVSSEIAIVKGDKFTIKGIESASEHARFDFISFVPVGKVSEPLINKIDDLNNIDDIQDNKEIIRFEAENGDELINYRLENNGAASGNKILSFVGQDKNEQGSVKFDFKGKSDTYNLVIGAFDESDGQASFAIEHQDIETGQITEIGSLRLDDNFGSNVANSKTFIESTIGFGVDLTPGDSIIVNGFENASEHARLDYLDLIPTDN